MRGGPRVFPQGSSCPVVLRILPCAQRPAPTGLSPSPACLPRHVPLGAAHTCGSPKPRGARAAVWAPPGSLAATSGIDVSFFSSGYLDVSVHRVPLRAPCIHARMPGVLPGGFPHSDTCGSRPICGSPQLFAACRVFRRLPAPRHPPCALSCLTFPLPRLAWRLRGPPSAPGAALPRGGIPSFLFFLFPRHTSRCAPRMSSISRSQT